MRESRPGPVESQGTSRSPRLIEFDRHVERLLDDRMSGACADEIVADRAVALPIYDKLAVRRHDGIQRGKAAVVRVGIEAAFAKQVSEPEQIGFLRGMRCTKISLQGRAGQFRPQELARGLVAEPKIAPVLVSVGPALHHARNGGRRTRRIPVLDDALRNPAGGAGLCVLRSTRESACLPQRDQQCDRDRDIVRCALRKILKDAQPPVRRQRIRVAKLLHGIGIEREFVQDLAEIVLREVQRFAAQDPPRCAEPDRPGQVLARGFDVERQQLGAGELEKNVASAWVLLDRAPILVTAPAKSHFASARLPRIRARARCRAAFGRGPHSGFFPGRQWRPWQAAAPQADARAGNRAGRPRSRLRGWRAPSAIRPRAAADRRAGRRSCCRGPPTVRPGPDTGTPRCRGRSSRRPGWRRDRP